MTAPIIAPSTEPQTPDQTDDDDFDHIFCCEENRSLCGVDLTGVEEHTGCTADCHICPMCEVIFNAGHPCSATCDRRS
jgi:hypothetical protein